MRNPRPIWLTPNAGRLYSDVVSLFTMSLDPKIKTSNWTAKQLMLLSDQIVLITLFPNFQGKYGGSRRT